MHSYRRTAAVSVAALLSLARIPSAIAQHAADNPVLSAQDAFGVTVGLESIGLYSPFMVRGFNPNTAGNARIDGLYFDEQGALSGRVIEGSTIHVGIGASGYAFPAPTGIVDYDLRHAGDGNATGTLIVQGGPYDNRSLSVDSSIPLYGKTLQLPFGASFSLGASNGGDRGYTSNIVNLGAVPRWTPSDRVTVIALIDWTRTTRARTLPSVFTAGNFRPPVNPRGFIGQYWALGRYDYESFGMLADAKLGGHWSLAAGVFRSNSNTPVSYADLFTNMLADGRADHVMVGMPDQRIGSTSGEARLTGQFVQGSWAHKFIAMARGRDTLSYYGGEDSVDVGGAYLGAPAQITEPNFVFGPRTRDHTNLSSVGIAYQVRRAGWGMLDIGVQKERYTKAVMTPGAGSSHLTDEPARMYTGLVLPLSAKTVIYCSYTQGFEDSGSAPSSAAYRGAILPTARTWQIEGGLRYSLTSKLSLVSGLFQLDKPYFNFDRDNIDRQLGIQRASGLELSLAGELTKGLTINAGALIGQVRIIGPQLAQQGVGSYAVGQPRNQEQLAFDYALPAISGLSVDVSLMHFGAQPATVNNAVHIPSVTGVTFGGRYQFRLIGEPASLRIQVQNATNPYIWNVLGSPGFVQFSSRTVLGYLTVDM